MDTGRVGRRLVGSALALMPAIVYTAIATTPRTADRAVWAAGAWLAVLVLAAVLRKPGAWVGTALLIAAAVVVPKTLWMLRVGRCGMYELAAARERVEAFKKEHGRAPADLAELGRLPVLRIWTVDEAERNHYHGATSAVRIWRGGEPPPDDGSWGYDPDTGRVFLSCTGLEPKVRRHPLHAL